MKSPWHPRHIPPPAMMMSKVSLLPWVICTSLTGLSLQGRAKSLISSSLSPCCVSETMPRKPDRRQTCSHKAHSPIQPCGGASKSQIQHFSKALIQKRIQASPGNCPSPFQNISPPFVLVIIIKESILTPEVHKSHL